MPKKALVTGAAGQDGSYLCEELLRHGYAVFGLVRANSNLTDVPAGVTRIIGDLERSHELSTVVQDIVFDEVYHLGGVSDLRTAAEFPEKTVKINLESVHNLFEASYQANPAVRFLQASSSEIFLRQPGPLDERSERDWQTTNQYARTKMMADQDIIQANRSARGAYACSAILFNHESPRHAEKFVLQKIARTIGRIRRGEESCLQIGNVDLLRDWSYAGDIVRGMYAALQLEKPEDFVFASGELHSVRQAIDIAAQAIDMALTWDGEGMSVKAFDQKGVCRVEVVPDFYRPTEINPKRGNPTKAKSMLGWKPEVSFEALVEMMVSAGQKE